MIGFANVKPALFTSLMAVTLGLAASATECGEYRIRGTLLTNTAGNFVVSVDHRRRSFREFILLGGKYEEKASRLETPVTVRVRIPRSGRDQDRPFAVLREFLKNTPSDKDGVSLIRRTGCGL